MYKELSNFLTEISKDSKFQVKLGDTGGYVEFGNTSGKSFILSLGSLSVALSDILDNLNQFIKHTRYIEQDWRDLGVKYFTNSSVNTMSTVQTKPLFTTLGKIINWANPTAIPDNPDLNINLSEENLQTTIKKLNQVIKEYTPEQKTKKPYDELVCEKKINVFAKKVLFYLQKYDNLGKILPYLKDPNDHGNASINYKHRNLTSIFKISKTELSRSELSSGGRPRNYSDALIIDGIDGYIYISTEWTGGEENSRLHLDDFMFIISDLYPEFNFITEEDRYCMVKNQDTDIEQEKDFKISTNIHGSLNFKYKNILLKGVPGTGKSYLIDKIITDKDKLSLKKNDYNILRINIHSASSNADLMQGIGIATKKDQIIYSEKQGLILNHMRKAITSPKQPFVIVLEEIQENSLNELIGDLIYLIEDSKRTDLSSEPSQDFTNMESFIEDYIQNNPKTYYVEIPYLVSTETRYKKMILPNNLYIFCTSNYRDDKKVIEDNLLRRFEVIEVYPAYKGTIGNDFKSKEVSDFLEKLNDKIVKHFQENGEIHPDRFMIGHAIWLDVIKEEEFYAKLLKVVTEFKDIKELDYDSDLKPILAAIDNYPFKIKKDEFQKNNYKDLVEYLQNKCYSDLLGNGQERSEEMKTSDDSEEKAETTDTVVNASEEINKDGANADQPD